MIQNYLLVTFKGVYPTTYSYGYVYIVNITSIYLSTV